MQFFDLFYRSIVSIINIKYNGRQYSSIDIAQNILQLGRTQLDIGHHEAGVG